MLLGLLSAGSAPTDAIAVAAAHDLLEGLIQARVDRDLQLAPLPLAAKRDGRNPIDLSGLSPRQQRYHQAQAEPVVQELLRRFEADIIAREPSPRAHYLARHSPPKDSKS